ncbi:MAG: N-acetyl-alpha-D-glucosaminyl L-malate synthase BshA, partial [Flavobacteriales bacterium]
LHVHYAIPHASAAITAKQVLAQQGKQIPVVTTLHGTDITLLGKDASFEPVISFAINQSDAVTAVSQSLKNDTYKLFGVNCDIDVIPNFVRIEPSKYPNSPEMRREFARDDERLWVHVSNFRPVKRIMDVIETFHIASREIPSKLLMIGDGPDRSKGEQRCRELGISDDVIYLGNLKNPLEVMGIADLFILPSESESFGLAALEAMAMGLPVISTNTGGLPEINRHGVTGMMSASGDVQDMAKNACYVLQDEKRLQQFKHNAMKRSLDFSCERIIPAYETLYQKIITQA